VNVQIGFLVAASLFFGIEFVVSIMTIGDVIAALPLLFWSALFAWWTALDSSAAQARQAARGVHVAAIISTTHPLIAALGHLALSYPWVLRFGYVLFCSPGRC
jgi:hypothetical protein